MIHISSHENRLLREPHGIEANTDIPILSENRFRCKLKFTTF
jgi:hypothetical protein